MAKIPTAIRVAKFRSPIFLTIALSLLLGALAAQDRDGDSGRYVILNAQYGTEHNHVDVTNRLRELARRDLQFRVEYNTINADPAPGRSKVLRVYARDMNGEERAFDFRDGSIFDGAQFRGWQRADWGDEHWQGGWNGRYAEHEHDADRRDFRDDHDADRHRDHDSGEFLILSAQYGTERRHVDVTHRLKELARRDVRFRMDNHTFGVDPDYGHHKVLRIYARDHEGRERMFEYLEHGWVDGSQFRGWGRGEWANENERWSGRWNLEEHEHEHDRR
ncbi:MAG: hypothetical protein JWQ87_1279 [Candidatus Sulfotelmatobacter sp.]|nr:hypothetical protein [Candidatus Sulfotelmatobacter sp.]